MLEEARVLGELLKPGMEAEAHDHLLRMGRRRSRACWVRRNGWRRTLEELRKHAVAYINSDSNERGFLLRGRIADLRDN